MPENTGFWRTLLAFTGPGLLVALLASGHNSTLTGTLAGQILMKDFYMASEELLLCYTKPGYPFHAT